MGLNIASAASSLLSLTVGALIGTEFSRYFYRPKVIVRYKDVDPNYDETGVYWSLQIENLGRTAATDCLANITLINVTKENIVEHEKVSLKENLPTYEGENIDLSLPRQQILSTKHFRTIRRASLCWAKLGNPEILDINPGASQSVDVCKYQKCENGDYFIFPSEKGWRKVRVRLSSEKLTGYVLICPSNEFPTRVNVEFFISSEGEPNISVSHPGFLDKIRFRANN